MSTDWLNWRFGSYHLHIGPWYVTWKQNPYWVEHQPERWFERYK